MNKKEIFGFGWGGGGGGGGLLKKIISLKIWKNWGF
jgi:hypothetical protein